MTHGVDLLVHRVTQSEITRESGNTSLGGGLHLNGTKRENTQKIVGGKKTQNKPLVTFHFPVPVVKDCGISL